MGIITVGNWVCGGIDKANDQRRDELLQVIRDRAAAEQEELQEKNNKLWRAKFEKILKVQKLERELRITKDREAAKDSKVMHAKLDLILKMQNKDKVAV